jgi:hypothetical protein
VHALSNGKQSVPVPVTIITQEQYALSMPVVQDWAVILP